MPPPPPPPAGGGGRVLGVIAGAASSIVAIVIAVLAATGTFSGDQAPTPPAQQSPTTTESSPSPSNPSTEQTPPPTTLPGDLCPSGNVSRNAATTSCDFAENVLKAYRRSGGSSTVQAQSPVTGLTYTMSCTTDTPHVCTGGNNAEVYFP